MKKRDDGNDVAKGKQNLIKLEIKISKQLKKMNGIKK